MNHICRRMSTFVLCTCLVLSIYYYNHETNMLNYNIGTIKNHISIHRKTLNAYNGTEDYLINTPGCYIPNYGKKLKYIEAKRYSNDCMQRAIFVKRKPNNMITFYIDKEKINKYKSKTKGNKKKPECCYQFAMTSTVGEGDMTLNYTKCKPFKNGTTISHDQEILTVTCVIRTAKKNNEIIYDDAYIILKELNNKMSITNEKRWNVLLLGMDTMSRIRFHSTMPKTVQYMKKNKWLDYRGYQKVGLNTFPNLMAVLSGKKITNENCSLGMEKCNDLMIWKSFNQSGYSTAYGEDFLSLPDTFFRYKGFKTPPTDHYMRPFFLTGEKRTGNFVCTKKMSSAEHLLDYAYQFVDAYAKKGFFGLFWSNSYSHNSDHIPRLIDNEIVTFFEKIRSSDVLNNTFVIFFSDHGIRNGKMREPMESYYDERLPMFSMWVPLEFRKLHEDEYYNLQQNQDRLTTPYDFYMTLVNILQISTSKYSDMRSDACPMCTSLFNQISAYRTCAESGVTGKWCSCHDMSYVNINDPVANASLQLAVSYIQRKVESVKTIGCMKCHALTLKTVIRIHRYSDSINNVTHHVIAFTMYPGNVSFEATVINDGKKLRVLTPTDTITPYNTRGNCVKDSRVRAYCVCDPAGCK